MKSILFFIRCIIGSFAGIIIAQAIAHNDCISLIIGIILLIFALLIIEIEKR